MNVARLLTRPVVVSTPGGSTVDEYGEPVTNPASTVTVDAYVEAIATNAASNGAETTVGQQTVKARWWAALPTDTPVTAESTLTIPDSGQTFQVIDDPDPRWNPRARRIEFIRVELSSENTSG